MKHTLTQTFTTCDICGSKQYHTFSLRWQFAEYIGLKFLHIKKYKVGKFFLVGQLLGEKEDIDMCRYCCESIKTHLNMLSKRSGEYMKIDKDLI